VDTPRRSAPSLKFWLFGGVLVALGMVFAFALGREVSKPTSQAVARPVVATPRPALTSAEEAYSQALWPIHNEVKAGALRMTLGGIQYKTGEIDAAALKVRVEASLPIYRRAEGQIRSLEPPASLKQYHDDYLQAVLLYQQAGAEMARVAEDQRDEHLVAAFPLSQDAGRKLRAVGAMLWPGEYVPS
jgi:hypothetical protein